jgi:nucleoside-diphosphate-sugar epimerase
MSERVVAILGCSGFVGGAVGQELRGRGVRVRPLSAPRLRCSPEPVRAVPAALDDPVVHALARQIDGADVVINAAGRPDGTAVASPELYGANSLLPVLLARACGLAGVSRFVHISSAAVQGSRALDETDRLEPFSPYSRSKALGERWLRALDFPVVVYRSTWVHDGDRANTRALVRLARSRASAVAGDGTAPTPQVLIGDVAVAVSHLALVDGPVPPVVLQPPSGMTTGLILRLLGDREPRHLPVALARGLVGGLRLGAGHSQRANAVARRAEMLLFGKRQVPGWLAERGVAPTVFPEQWRRLAGGAPHDAVNRRGDGITTGPRPQ